MNTPGRVTVENVPLPDGTLAVDLEERLLRSMGSRVGGDALSRPPSAPMAGVIDAIESTFPGLFAPPPAPEPEPEPEEDEPPPESPKGKKGKKSASKTPEPKGKKTPEPKGKKSAEPKGKSPTPGKKGGKKGAEPKPEPEPEPEPETPKEKTKYELRLEEIEEQFQTSVSAAEQLEEYLTQAEQLAAENERASLAQRDVDAYTPEWRRIGLPLRPSHLHIDGRTAAEGRLVNPDDIQTAYLENVKKEVLNPPPTYEYNDASIEPHYLVGTGNTRVRAEMLEDTVARVKEDALLSKTYTWHKLDEDEVKKRTKESAARRKMMKTKMPGDQVDVERAIMKAMHHKLDFLRNPRFVLPSDKKRKQEKEDEARAQTPASKKSVMSDLNKPAWVGPLTRLPTGDIPPSKHGMTTKLDVAFQMQPPEILFEAYVIGETYELSILLTNVTANGRRLRIAPPASQFFFISQIQFPGESGFVAPGMSCRLVVRFCPDSLANYDDHFTLDTELARLHIPLRARRKPPSLTLPVSIKLGDVIVGNVAKTAVPIQNRGGGGRFRILPADMWPEQADQVSREAVTLGCFTLRPVVFGLEEWDNMELEVTFAPTSVGTREEHFVIVADNSQVLPFSILGLGTGVDVHLVEVDGSRPPLHKADTPMWFSEVVPGGTRYRSLVVQNRTPLPLPFAWQFKTKRALTPAARAGAQPVTLDLERLGVLPEEPMFSIEPSEGMLQPHEMRDFTLAFAPTARKHYVATCRMLVDKRLPDEREKCDTPVMELSLQGMGGTAEVDVRPARITAGGVLLVGEVATRDLTVVNPNDAPVKFRVDGADEAVVMVVPRDGEVPPGSSVTVAVRIGADRIRNIEEMLRVVIAHGSSYTVPVVGEVTGPCVNVTVPQAPHLDYGLTQLDTVQSGTIVLSNPSPLPTPWVLEELQHLPPRPPAPGQPPPEGAPLWRALTALERNRATHLRFEPSHGTLPPHATLPVRVDAVAVSPGAHRALARCTTNLGGRTSTVAVRADVVRPQLALSAVTWDLGETYVGIPIKKIITVRNMTLLPAEFMWDATVYGNDDLLDIQVKPMRGKLPPNGEKLCRVKYTPRRAGTATCHTAVDVGGVINPSAFTTTTLIKDISVETITFKVQTEVEIEREAALAAGLQVEELEDEDRQHIERLRAAHEAGRPEAHFGDDVPLGHTRSIYVTVSNSTGISVPLSAWVDEFAAPDIGEALSTDLDKSLRSAAGTGASKKRNTIRLNMGRKQTNRIMPFRSDRGNAMMATRRMHDAARGILGDRGIAISVTPDTAELAPFSSVRITVSVANDMAGTYLDKLHIAAGDLDPKPFPIRVGVVGTPLQVQREGMLIRGYAEAQPTRCALPFGAIPTGHPLERTFYVFNTSCMGVSLDWTAFRFILKRDDGRSRAPSRRTSASLAGLLGGAADAPPPKLVDVRIYPKPGRKVDLSIDPHAVPADDDGPFAVSPRACLLRPGAKQRFTVRMAAEHTPDETRGYLLGHQSLDPPDGGITANFAANSDPKTASSRPLDLLLTGSYHGSASRPGAPIPPLRVDLSVLVENARLQVKDDDELSFYTHAPHNPAKHRSYVRIPTLSNMHKCALSFSLRVQGAAFKLISATPSTPQDPDAYEGTKSFTDGMGTMGPTGLPRELYLPPQESCDVKLQFVPEKRAERDDYDVSGAIDVTYQNGTSQEFPLHARVEHPELIAAPEVVDFGLVHPQAPKPMVITLTNPTFPDAEWTAGPPGGKPPRAHAKAPPAGSVRLGHFTIEPAGATIPGKGLTFPKTGRVTVTFAPPDNAAYEERLRFWVRQGRSADVVLRGQGTFDEVAEHQRPLKLLAGGQTGGQTGGRPS